MSRALMSKNDVLAILVATFRRDGYDGASIATLSEATGLGKSSLYHHFPGGKVDMATQVLDFVHGWVAHQIVATLEGTGTPRARLTRALDILSEFYDHGAKGCVVGRLCASVDRRHFQRQLDRVLRTWIGAIAALLGDAGLPAAVARERAEDAVIRIQGSLVLSSGLGEPGPFRRVMKRLTTDLLAPVPARARKRT